MRPNLQLLFGQGQLQAQAVQRGFFLASAHAFAATRLVRKTAARTRFQT